MSDTMNQVTQLLLEAQKGDRSALEALARMDTRLARVAELRHFGGLSTPAVAEILGLDRAKVEQEWRVARAWLKTRLRGVAA
jgi:DNA-directed RNA polymerase specialized sigma24 family protein